MTTAFIEDGATEKGFCKGREGIYPDFRFVYRPCTWEERRAFLATPDDQVKAAAGKLLGEKLVSADAVNSAGQPVPVTPANVLKLRPALLERVLLIVLGSLGSDVDPQWPEEDKKAHADDSFRGPA